MNKARATKASKMARPKPVGTEDPSSVSEHEMDSICGMLMQLESEMDHRISDRETADRKGDGNRSSLRITQDEKMEAAASGALFSIMLSDKDVNEKESDTKRILESRGHFSNAAEDGARGWDSGVNARDGRGRTPLTYAVAEGSATTIEILLNCDRVDYLSRDRSGNTALMYACVRGYDSVIRLFMNEFKRKYQDDSATLLDYLDAENVDGDTAFTLALENGHEDCAIALSEYLKEALEKEERRVTSLAYRVGLRRKSESRMPSMLSLKEADVRKIDSVGFQSIAGGHSPDLQKARRRRRRSASPVKTKGDKLAMVSSMVALARRGRDASRYHADEKSRLLESEKSRKPKGSPERRHASPVSQLKVNLDLRADHQNHYLRHYRKGGGRSNRSEKSAGLRRRCDRRRSEDKQPLCKEEDESANASDEVDERKDH